MNCAIITALLLIPVVATGADKVSMNDREIAAVMLAANGVNVETAKAVPTRSANPEVQRYAEQTAADHGNANKQLADMLKGMKLRPQDNDISRGLKGGGTDAIKALIKLSGTKFDREYLNKEVVFHKTLLTTIDESLLPGVRGGKLKVLILELRPVVAAHLEHARQLQSRLMDSAASPKSP